MPNHAVLLRGINVGGNKKIPMAQLRDLLSGMGFDDVRTHLQSGNAVFGATGTPSDLADRIERAIAAEFGMTVRCIVRTGPELAAVVAGHPFTDVADNGSRMMVLFLSATPDPALVAAHDALALDPDRTRLGDRVIYQWCPDGLLAAPDVATYVMRNWDIAVTARNWNTVSKLAGFLAP